MFVLFFTTFSEGVVTVAWKEAITRRSSSVSKRIDCFVFCKAYKTDADIVNVFVL
jgi:hypothetical protein